MTNVVLYNQQQQQHDCYRVSRTHERTKWKTMAAKHAFDDVNNRRELSIPQVPALVLGGPPTFDTCNYYDVDYDQVLRDKLRPNSTWRTAPCRHGWNYDLEQTRYPTIVSEVGLRINSIT